MAHNHPPLVWDLETSGINIEIWILLSTCLTISHVPFTLLTSPNPHTHIHTPPQTPHTDSYPDATPIHDRGHKKPIHAPHGTSAQEPNNAWFSLPLQALLLFRQPLTRICHPWHAGKSRSNLSLGLTPSMTSVIEEPRQSISTSSEPNIVIWSELWLAEGHLTSYFCTWRSTSVVTS